MSDEFPTRGRLAGIDYGTVRIGIAITDPDRTMASPYENYARGNAVQNAQRFQRLVTEENVVGFVVGLPVYASGDESAKSREARDFGKWLAEVTSLPVTFYDERYTSVEAEQLLGQAELTKKKRKRRLDMLAAQIMLASFIESRGPHHPGALDDRDESA